MTEADVTWTRAVKVWWSLTWRSLLYGGFAFFAVMPIVMGLTVLLSAQPDPANVSLAASVGGAVAACLVVVWVVKRVLRTRFRDFRIALLLLEETTEANEQGSP